MINLLKKYKEVCGSYGFGSFLLIASFFMSFGIAIVYVPRDSWILFMIIFIIGQAGSVLSTIQFNQVINKKSDLVKEYEEGLIRLGQNILQVAPIKLQEKDEWNSAKKVWQRATIIFDFLHNDNENLSKENKMLMKERIEITKENEKLRLREKEKTFGEKSTAIADLQMEK